MHCPDTIVRPQPGTILPPLPALSLLGTIVRPQPGTILPLLPARYFGYWIVGHRPTVCCVRLVPFREVHAQVVSGVRCLDY
jgi:hypothetical protein